MVYIDSDTQVSATVAEKSRNTWIRKINDWSYAVTPRGPWGTKRRVTLRLRGDLLLAHCEHYYDGTLCPANRFGGLCYTVARVIQHLEAKVRREESRAA